jgi:hypothetical protein
MLLNLVARLFIFLSELAAERPLRVEQLTQIISDLCAAPTMTATLMTQEYAKRYGPDGCVEEIAATLLADLLNPICRHN